MPVVIDKKIDDLKKNYDFPNMLILPYSKKLKFFGFLAKFIKENEHRDIELEILRQELGKMIPEEEKLSDYIIQSRKDRV